MDIEVTPTGQACGASVTGVDLSQALTGEQVAELRRIWLEHQVLAFPGQTLSDDDLERFTRYFGPFGEDPFIKPISGRENVIAIRRDADETSSLFAESWHSDWSFQAAPPAGTCLYGLRIPPVGGDTLFANQQLALQRMPAELRARLEGLWAVHSAMGGYAPDGLYGDQDKAAGRSMAIEPSESALATQRHPLIRRHPETGVEGLFSCLGYIVGFEGMAQDAALELLTELLAWQTRPEFIYRHRWQAGTLVMWDNRAVLHRATGGYEGHDRLLHRTTIGARDTA
ncbi:TauD/TfdA dioxygenase family protein [Parahaliea mediterranea]|uniref:TauD/TfdA family dioxygenase n=1 Tax=Parahaliea mediterranea TaxID=651086 RepID=A0A939DDJ8_9GAMM|nr:TauD/TfdA family dioxygenase [Parahaliea mediterranea]MBN7796120.1 TauD/TfdA family dioxygenase [Parahaliea mediterranea]